MYCIVCGRLSMMAKNNIWECTDPGAIDGVCSWFGNHCSLVIKNVVFALNSPSRLYILYPGCQLFDLTLQSNSNMHTHWNTVWVCLCRADRFAGMEDQTRRLSQEAGKALSFWRQKSPEAGWEPETSKVSTPLNRNSQPVLGKSMG